MFLDYFKEFWTKKIVKKSLSNAKLFDSDKVIQTVGVLIDESSFSQKEALIQELIHNGIQEKNIKILVFRDKVKKNEVFDYPVFSYKDLTWIATIPKKEVVSFVKEPFDLLINYYDTERTVLLLVSHLSKAFFKVGFSSVDKRVNHFMIDTPVENHKIFATELFKYLKILNKI